jgi:protein-tyrosine phosphatase
MPATPRRVLFVCLGNICRSPMAEAMFQSLVDDRMLTHRFHIDSAGILGSHAGRPPHRETLATLSRHGLTTLHLGRKVGTADLVEFDEILALDVDVERRLHEIGGRPELAAKVRLLRHYDPEAAGDLSVPDPYGRSAREFELVYSMIDRSLRGLLDALTAPR